MRFPVRVRALAILCWALCVLGVVAASPGVAQTAQSVNRNLIQRLNAQYIYVALPLTLFVMVILVYAVVRFRNNDDPRPTADDAPLEITWTVVTGLILLFVGVSAYSVLANPYLSPDPQEDETVSEEGDAVGAIPNDAVVVELVAYQWEWQFTHPDANVTTRNEVVIPADEDVYFVMTSRDVVHSFTVPELGVKQDVFPESQTVIRTHVYETGEYEAMCIEFCGARHSDMRANVTVVDSETYDEWLATNGEGGGAGDGAGDDDGTGDGGEANGDNGTNDGDDDGDAAVSTFPTGSAAPGPSIDSSSARGGDTINGV